MPTPNWGLPILTGTEAMSFKGLYNAQSNALETGMDNLSKVAGIPRVASAAARNTLLPSPVQGNRVFRLDLGWDETYYAAYNVTTNPGGATPAGWYPTFAGAISVIGQAVNVAVGSGPASNSIANGALLSTSPTTTYTSGTGAITFTQPGEYQVLVATTQLNVNGTGQRNIAIGGTSTVLANVPSHNYLAMGGIANGAYYGRFNIRVTASGQTSIPSVLQNSGSVLNFTTQASFVYVGPNKG